MHFLVSRVTGTATDYGSRQRMTLNDLYMQAINLTRAFSVILINYKFSRNRPWAVHETNAESKTVFRNSNKSPTKCNNFSSILLDVYLQLSMFWASSRPLSGAQQLQ